MHPHENLLAKNSIAVTDLPEKTQKKIAKFAAETDDDKRETIDESIYGDVEDFIADKAAKEKADAKKASHAAAKKEASDKKKVDVSGAPTAAGTPVPAGTPPPKKEKSMMDHIYGRK
jgi:hypothetical protein